MAKLVKGEKLNAEQRQNVLAAYVHRWTKENPHRLAVYGSCALCDIRNPYENAVTANGHTHPTIPLITDAEWLTEHAFYINKDGRLSDRPGHCEPAYMADTEAQAA